MSSSGGRTAWTFPWIVGAFLGGVLVAEWLWTPAGEPPFAATGPTVPGFAERLGRIGLLAALCVAAAVRTHRLGGAPRRVLWCLAFAALGFLRAESDQTRWNSVFRSLRQRESAWAWTGGRVEERPRDGAFGVTVSSSLSLPGRPVAQLRWTGPWRPLPGDAWAGACAIRPMLPAGSPGSVDPRRRARSGGYGAAVTPLCIYDAGRSPSWPLRLRRAVQAAGRAVARRLAEGLSPVAAGFLSAFLLGRRDALDHDQIQSFRDTGTAHLLAISGLHVGFFALAVSPILGWAGRRRGLRIVLWALVLGLFALLTGGAPPVWRASFMIVCHQIGLLRGRCDGAMTGWLAGAFVEGLRRPGAVPGPSFTLSYLATLGLVLAARRGWLGVPASGGGSVDRNLSARIRDGVRAVAIVVGGTMRASAVVLFVTGPLLAAYFGRWLPMSILFNVLMVPAAGLLLPAALSSLALSLLPGFIGRSQWAVLDAAVRAFLDLQTGARGLIPDWPIAVDLPAPLAVVLSVLLCFLLLGPRARRAASVLVLLLGVCAMGRGLVRSDTGPWSATFLSLGRGEAVLLEWPGAPPWLIDTGPEGQGQGVAPCARALEGLGVARLGLVFLTHDHGDHAGGLGDVLRRWPVESLMVGPGLAAPFRRRYPATPVREIGEGWLRSPTPGVRVRVLHPPDPHDLDPNNGSLVIHVKGYGMSLLMTGDLETPGEDDLLERSSVPRAAVLKLGHHGRATSSSGRFLNRVAPVAALALGRRTGAAAVDEGARRRLAGERVLLVDASRTGAIRLLARGGDWILRPVDGTVALTVGVVVRPGRFRGYEPSARFAGL